MVDYYGILGTDWRQLVLIYHEFLLIVNIYQGSDFCTSVQHQLFCIYTSTEWI